jgi:hypothetical protein
MLAVKNDRSRCSVEADNIDNQSGISGVLFASMLE